MSWWKAARIQDIVKLELRNLATVDAFCDIGDKPDNSRSGKQNLGTICNMHENEIAAGCSRTDG